MRGLHDARITMWNACNPRVAKNAYRSGPLWATCARPTARGYGRPTATSAHRRETAHWKRRGEIAHEALAVAPEPVELIGRVTPAVALPGLQSDSRDEPRFLADRRFELARKVLARGHEGATSAVNRDEKLR